jgi:hypothetical protein
MDERVVSQYIVETFEGVDRIVSGDGTFFIYDPDRDLDPARTFPFATLVTSDAYDQASNLDRPSVFRLNVGVSRETFNALFGADTAAPDADETAETSYDYTALDRLMPHPVYAREHWVCVLNPSTETFESVRPLLAEAHARAVRRHRNSRPATDA